MTRTTPEQYRDRAMAALSGGDAERAEAIFREAVGNHPDDARLWNSFANLCMRIGRPREAADHFGTALAREPGSMEYAVNRAIALCAADEHGAALALLRSIEGRAAGEARYASARGTAARGTGDLDEAALWYDRALGSNPDNMRARHGRARVALERGETDALDRFESALRLNAGEPELWLGKAKALDAAGRGAEAREIAEALADRAPQWLDGLEFLAQLNLADEVADYAAPYREAARRVPYDPAIPAAHCGVLAGLGHAREAADVAAQARARFPDDGNLAFLEAIHSSEAGMLERADRAFALVARDTHAERIYYARHMVRKGELAGAEELLTRSLDDPQWRVNAWALRGLIWRIRSDPRAHWLHEQEGLVQVLPLRDREAVLPEVISLLDDLHDRSALPLGQSLRGGTQTRGILFARRDPVLQALANAIRDTLDDYRTSLPPADDGHPLLRYRDCPWRLGGSWSVRHSGGSDHHAPHIHPQGILSSALYLRAPHRGSGGRKEGVLEIGRPPENLCTGLPALETIEPKIGHLALFPSTLFHGTRPFSTGGRMTVAFDVTAALDQSA